MPFLLIAQEQVLGVNCLDPSMMRLCFLTGKYSWMLNTLVHKTMGIHEGQKFLFG